MAEKCDCCKAVDAVVVGALRKSQAGNFMFTDVPWQLTQAQLYRLHARWLVKEAKKLERLAQYKIGKHLKENNG